jgi:hypothetical protein
MKMLSVTSENGGVPMRLIEQLRWWAAECDRTNFGCQARKLLLEAAEALEKAEPVKHGRWVVETKIYDHNPSNIFVRTVCSECDRRIRTDRFSVDEWNDYKKDHYSVTHENYCPNCGAKMDGGEAE